MATHALEQLGTSVAIDTRSLLVATFLERYEPKVTRKRPSSDWHGAKFLAQEAGNAASGCNRQPNAGAHEAKHGRELGDRYDVVQGQTD